MWSLVYLFIRTLVALVIGIGKRGRDEHAKDLEILVLPGEPENERTDRRIDRWPAWPTGPSVRPLPAHELAMPAEEGRRGDEKGDPAVSWENPACGREQDPVDDPELRWARRPLQHPELMAENEDLEVLGSVDSTSPSGADEETDEGPDDEVEEGQHRPIVRGGTSANLGFRPPRPLARVG